MVDNDEDEEDGILIDVFYLEKGSRLCMCMYTCTTTPAVLSYLDTTNQSSKTKHKKHSLYEEETFRRDGGKWHPNVRVMNAYTVGGIGTVNAPDSPSTKYISSIAMH